jgi:hypothetical protein
VGDGGSDELNGAVRAGLDALKIDDLEDSGGEVLRVGVVDWDGPAATSMVAVTGYIRKTA